ncbi:MULTISPECIES: hypothetical protein [Haloferax]|uniref:Glycine zipper-like domain-containing protein n=2 Tax=Haloferax TaxID=2251 RepID=A0A6G1Z2J6_9EURY|nr:MULTISPECIES: hypothetical protein [Haloferax]KAB1188093.1 hypothetical protein Hfx1149_08610 [Haloferax sp. CBA1149]MRW80766.1 hypothetical protein [Haloferax marinisediminis]
MSQESASLSAEFVQQPTPELVDHVFVDSDDREGTSHSAEQFGIGLAGGVLLGGIVGLIVGSLQLGVLYGLLFGVVVGLYLMEVR